MHVLLAKLLDTLQLEESADQRMEMATPLNLVSIHHNPANKNAMILPNAALGNMKTTMRTTKNANYMNDT